MMQIIMITANYHLNQENLSKDEKGKERSSSYVNKEYIFSLKEI